MKLAETLKKLDKDPEPETVECQFCNKTYPLSKDIPEDIFSYAPDCDAFADTTTVKGDFGSSHDESTLYWATPSSVVGVICDQCISAFIENGKLVASKKQTCHLCQKLISDEFYTRVGTIVEPPGWRIQQVFHYPYSDKYTMSKKMVFWCLECGIKQEKNLEQPHFVYPHIDDYIFNTHDPTEYRLIRKQMQLKALTLRELVS